MLNISWKLISYNLHFLHDASYYYFDDLFKRTFIPHFMDQHFKNYLNNHKMFFIHKRFKNIDKNRNSEMGKGEFPALEESSRARVLRDVGSLASWLWCPGKWWSRHHIAKWLKLHHTWENVVLLIFFFCALCFVFIVFYVCGLQNGFGCVGIVCLLIWWKKRHQLFTSRHWFVLWKYSLLL